ncbi:acetyl-CoA carboxylase carboxyl transferase subunit beta [Jatrophihabitans sp. GAS493]|uniref:carboxyl transferase domain-containing protein n=1 Tax=Jatrophihabitans sp. GAS493 TaxID=1907575 RepID=UPI000BB6BE72|nr:carboxyl transferase domain-containing protein [Jatrophihabitans sp. GAS493]SOD73751.1 acetyl-CoA carboxylase carboxyl transferase subunit beta [Jatrophihabitans sp. GAS493]
MERVGALELIERVADSGSFRSWDSAPLPPFAPSGHLDDRYLAELAEARERTGLDESVITGEARVGGHRVAVLIGEFGFLGGSIGVAAGHRIVEAIERATAQRLPLVASPTSGGTRMQEGTVAFLQMVAISTAVANHRRSGQPYLAYLRNPTTGGVFASWGSLAHVTVAEPGALIGFLGPRVYEAIYNETFPPGVQTAENLYEHGLIDAVVAPEQLRELTITALDVVAARRDVQALDDPVESGSRDAGPSFDDGTADLEELEPTSAWDSIRRTRRPERPSVRALLKVAARDVTPLRGTGQGEEDSGMLLALARFDDSPCVVLGQDRRGPAPLGPGGLRIARRGMHLANELRLPLVTVVDTAGAALSVAAEEGGLAGEIARCLAELATLDTPTLCLLLGQGAGGGALALLATDRVVAAQHAWLSPLPPEGASVIRYKTTSHAAEIAQAQGVRSLDLLRNRVVDRIVPENPDAADEPEKFLRRLGGVIGDELDRLTAWEMPALRARRVERYRSLGLN